MKPGDEALSDEDLWTLILYAPLTEVLRVIACAEYLCFQRRDVSVARWLFRSFIWEYCYSPGRQIDFLWRLRTIDADEAVQGLVTMTSYYGDDLVWSDEVAYRHGYTVYTWNVPRNDVMQRYMELYLERSRRARQEVYTWTLCARRIHLYKDVARIIAHMLWSMRYYQK